MPDDLDNLECADRLADLGHSDQAEAIYRQLVALEPNSPELRHRLAAPLLQTDRLDEAIRQCRLAIGIRPRYPTVLNTLGVALSRSGQHPEAIAALEAVLAADPGYAKAAFNLGQVLDQCGRQDAAIAAYRRAPSWISRWIWPDSSWRRSASCRRRPGCRRPTSFDYSTATPHRFDAHLTELNYTVPELLFDAVSRIAPGNLGRVVDLGCGTGLVGAAFRSRSEQLTGIDLAPAMIAAAAQRGVYDALIQAEVVDWLAAAEPTCSPRLADDIDLLLAADLLIYLGDLQPLLAAARRLIKPAGLLAFSLERGEQHDYVLQPTRRYAHLPDYLRRLAAENDWTVASCTEAVLRNQGSAGAAGLIFVLRAGVTDAAERTFVG